MEHVLASLQVNHLHHGHLLDVSDVAHGLQLLGVACPVSQVEHEVVGVGDLQLLDFLGLVAYLLDGSVHTVLCLHEVLVLRLDLAHHSCSVEFVFPRLPVNGLCYVIGQCLRGGLCWERTC